ncbi:hypothetical protein THAOC_12388, partial [Thalassiosira oceanica]
MPDAVAPVVSGDVPGMPQLRHPAQDERGSGKTTWEPVSTSTSTATPCFHIEISGFEPPDTPQIQQVYGAMNPLLAYTLALMNLPAFYMTRGSGKTTWEPVSTSTSTATPCFHAEFSGSEPPHTPYGALYRMVDGIY